jgi:hypothetical protein
MADETDLGNLLDPETETDPKADYSRCAVVGRRFKSAEEAEAAEAAYLARMTDPSLLDKNPLWPIPTLDADGNVEHLTAAEREQLTEFFGVTEEEYRQLYERPE